MNIFKALSEGNGKISETNITSFMNYLLDSSNELNNSLALLFFQLIDKSLTEKKILELLNLDNNSDLRSLIVSFNQKYSISAEPEYSVKGDDGTIKIPDIILIVRNKDSEDVLYLIIENKIKKSAKNDSQIKKQFEYITSSDDFSKDTPIYNILITPDEKIFESMYQEGLKANKNTIWLKWYSINPDETIVGILQKLIEFEQNAKIQPIDLNTLYILKSFIDYLSTQFIVKSNGKRNFDIKGFSVIDEISYQYYNNKTIFIRRYSNQMIRIFDEDENIINPVKPLLKEIIEKESLNIDLSHSTKREKNTQIIGAEVIKELKEK